MDLLKGFFKFLKTHHLPLDARQPTLLTVSGGLDSVVMTHLFKCADLPFAIAHCNFQLRDAESDGDELFVQKIALDYEVPFFVKRFETKDYAEQHQISIQMAARELRYEWFAQIARENDYPYIATAHHLNDSVETALLNFVRGTGLSGLTGIAPLAGNLIRPLLFASKNELLEYALSHHLSCREDSSNESDDYTRNFIRHHIVPPLEAINPSFLRTAARNMERIGEADENLHFLLQQWLPIDPTTRNQLLPFTIAKKNLEALPAPAHALRQLLKPYGFEPEQARQAAENLEHTGFELLSGTGFRLLIDRKEITVQPEMSTDTNHAALSIQEDDLMIRLPDGSRLFFLHPDLTAIPSDHNTGSDSAVIDASKVIFPLKLRHWAPGDHFQPLGMEGKSQKLQDFFTNQKLSRLEKEEAWILFNGNGDVIWILGRRLDERFKIREKTTAVLKLNWMR